jgi:hypothetical protein
MAALSLLETARVQQSQHNNPGAADGIKILVLMQKRSAAADQERVRFVYPK